jgi:hypothetical protein
MRASIPDIEIMSLDGPGPTLTHVKSVSHNCMELNRQAAAKQNCHVHITACMSKVAGAV